MSVQVTTSTMASTIYRRILGGPQSDKLLSKCTLEIVGKFINGKRVLDIGIGDGRNTRKYINLNPASIVVTDYQKETVTTTGSKLYSEFPNQSISYAKLDLTDMVDFAQFAPGSFDLVICNSVLMHLGSDDTTNAIAKLGNLIKTNGHLLVGVICGTLARKLYIPASSKGSDYFYPRLKDLPEDACENDIPDDCRCLAERYPENMFYQRACAIEGFTLETHDAIIGDECKGSVYEPYSGQPLWKLHLMRRYAP